MRIWVALVLALLPIPNAVGGTVCGVRDDSFLVIASLATAAPALCSDIDELSDTETGLIVGASGADIKDPVCERQLGMMALKFKGDHAKDASRFCAAARALLADYPATKHMIKPASSPASCNEIDRAAAIIAAGEKLCQFSVTDAGKAIRGIAKGGDACQRPHLVKFEKTLGDFTKARNGDKVAGAKAWCAGFLAVNEAQTKAGGMLPWMKAP